MLSPTFSIGRKGKIRPRLKLRLVPKPGQMPRVGFRLTPELRTWLRTRIRNELKRKYGHRLTL